ncbi:MAG: flagellar motor protein MotB [Hydrogenovibrio sp.]|uniref:OmpA/MotB family protein n=1 Tax=Hydrogenovibrio sp. TaxID=2065821 RepID=UPI00286FBD39|nr:flagellar motor protein MotB [Hydrogenovibrio sp.]MDR9497861.1 flagellar motor protein MotB [Hydrogenovibrio sp.]
MAKKCDKSQSWLATFADLMSLLMAIFVLLFSMSTLDADKYEAIVKSLTKTLGHGQDLTQTQVEYFKKVKEEQESNLEKKGETTLDDLKPLYESLIDTYSDSNETAQENNIDVTIEPEEKQIKISFPERISFPSGRATLKPDFVVELRKLRVHIGQNDQVKAVGHSDKRPVTGGRFRSNWELSSARAAAVIEQLIDDQVARPEQCQVVGVGPTEPLVDEDTPQAYTKNRRVEIIIRPAPKITLEEQVLGVRPSKSTLEKASESFAPPTGEEAPKESETDSENQPPPFTD